MITQIDIAENTGMYASKWGVSDFYAEAEETLSKALASKEDFDTGWFGCKKEIHSARITRENGETKVQVECEMDDLWEEGDLIYDALWEVAQTEEQLPDDVIDSIIDAACDEQLDDKTVTSIVLPADTPFFKIVATLDALEEEADTNNKAMYKRLCEIVKAHLEYMKENGIDFVHYD